jgi:alpha-acetolactate decarboxylase
MVYKPQSMSAVDLFRHIDRQPSLHLCQAVRPVIMLMKRCPQENARYGEKWSVGNFTGKLAERIIQKGFHRALQPRSNPMQSGS